MINEGISIVGLTEVNSTWSRVPIKENIYNRTGGWFKRRRISTRYIRVTTSDRPFQSGGTYIMAVGEVSCIVISIGQ